MGSHFTFGHHLHTHSSNDTSGMITNNSLGHHLHTHSSNDTSGMITNNGFGHHLRFCDPIHGLFLFRNSALFPRLFCVRLQTASLLLCYAHSLISPKKIYSENNCFHTLA